MSYQTNPMFRFFIIHVILFGADVEMLYCVGCLYRDTRIFDRKIYPWPLLMFCLMFGMDIRGNWSFNISAPILFK